LFVQKYTMPQLLNVATALHQGAQNLTVSASIHLLLPVLLNSAFADGPIDKPAQMTGLKFPCRTFFSAVARTFLDDPARLLPLQHPSLSGDQEQDLPLNVARHGSPSLLVAVYSLNRGPEELCHLLLRFIQFPSEVQEFFTVHWRSQEAFVYTLMKHSDVCYHIVVVPSTRKTTLAQARPLAMGLLCGEHAAA
jgi:hypothetical protein